jgi:predicted ArsR family transcriptional regulator
VEDDKQHRFSKEEIATTGARILSDLWNNTFQALIDNAGAEKALELIKPYMKFHGFAAGYMLMEELKVSGKDGLSFLTIWITTSSIFDVTYSAIEKTSTGYRFDVSRCPIGNYTWAHCEVWCAQVGNAIVEAHFPGCSISFEQMLTKGDPRCRCIVTDKSVKGVGEVTKLDIELPKLSQDFKEYKRAGILAQTWVYATNALVDYAGPEKAIELMRPYMRQSGMSMGLDLYTKLGIMKRDATSIALVIRFINACLQQKGEVVKSEVDRVEKEITECPFSNASQDICASLLSIRSNGICEAINPEYEFVSEKRMCKGDKSCHWVIKKKNPS